MKRPALVDVCKFPAFSLRRPVSALLVEALAYHCTYHHTSALHVNHLVFLHTYLFGVFVLFAASGSAAVVATVAVLYACYTVLLLRAAWCAMLPYAAFVQALAMLAWEESQRFGWSPATTCAVALATILASFASQLVGHTWFEEFVAPPSLAHGLLAAPPLEYLCLLARLGWPASTALHHVVDEKVKQLRARARALAEGQYCSTDM